MQLVIFAVFVLFVFTGCNNTEREKKLQEKETELARKEQELLVKENELLKREKLLDSAPGNRVTDTLSASHTYLPGNWTVTMRCTQTNCPGFAVGDIKTEQWRFGFQNNEIVAEAFSSNSLVRVYRGTYSGNSIQLFAKLDGTNEQTTKMTVKLQQSSESKMEGERHLERMEGCYIVYALEAKKQQ